MRRQFAIRLDFSSRQHVPALCVSSLAVITSVCGDYSRSTLLQCSDTSPRVFSPSKVSQHLTPCLNIVGVCMTQNTQTTDHPKAKSAPTYDTPFTRETEPWGARAFVSVQPRHPEIPAAVPDSSRKLRRDRPPSRLSVVSYNVLADSNILRVRNCAQAVTNWGRRREILLKEIFSVR